MSTSYEANKKWRLANPKKRGKSKDTYYRKHRYRGMNRKRYSPADEELILTKKLDGKKYLDRDIASLIGRSLKAVQVKRSKLRSVTLEKEK